MATLQEVELADRQRDDMQERFRADVLAGLAQPQKAVPARWFYDHRGSELFEEITSLPEYYPTRAEREILAERSTDIAREVGSGRAVVEFGAGSAAKTPLLLDALDPACYVPIDISGDFLRESCGALARRYPAMPIVPVEADFTRAVDLPRAVEPHAKLGFFPGSTIGNLDPRSAVDLLRSMRETLGDGSTLVIGMDAIKDRGVLTAAYDDSAGVTAAFNINLAERINRELGGTLPLDSLRHRIRWNAERARIEMHLEAVEDLSFAIAGRRFAMRAGETIHTENSHKYDRRSAAMLLLAGGWNPRAYFFDKGERFMVVLAEAAGEHFAP